MDCGGSGNLSRGSVTETSVPYFGGLGVLQVFVLQLTGGGLTALGGGLALF